MIQNKPRTRNPTVRVGGKETQRTAIFKDNATV